MCVKLSQQCWPVHYLGKARALTEGKWRPSLLAILAAQREVIWSASSLGTYTSHRRHVYRVNVTLCVRARLQSWTHCFASFDVAQNPRNWIATVDQTCHSVGTVSVFLSLSVTQTLSHTGANTQTTPLTEFDRRWNCGICLGQTGGWMCGLVCTPDAMLQYANAAKLIIYSDITINDVIIVKDVIETFST
jgi:hypothetical protein